MMMSDLSVNMPTIEQLEVMVKEATPLPWRIDTSRRCLRYALTRSTPEFKSVPTWSGFIVCDFERDAKLIVGMLNALPYLFAIAKAKHRAMEFERKALVAGRSGDTAQEAYLSLRHNEAMRDERVHYDAARTAGLFGEVGTEGEWKPCRACGKAFMGSDKRTLCVTCNRETGAGEP